MKPLVPTTLLLTLAACGPGIEVVTPENGATLTRSADDHVTVTLRSHGWELAPPGQCGDRKSCGHLVVRLTEDEQISENAWSGMACGEMFEPSDTGFELDLTQCTRQVGMFGLMVYLHHDNHYDVEGGGVVAFSRFVVED